MLQHEAKNKRCVTHTVEPLHVHITVVPNTYKLIHHTAKINKILKDRRII